MRGFGIFLLIGGSVGMAAAFLYPVTITPDALQSHHALMDSLRGLSEDQAPATIGAWAISRQPMVNIDKLAVRAMLDFTAMAIAIIGAIFTGAGVIRAAVKVKPDADTHQTPRGSGSHFA